MFHAFGKNMRMLVALTLLFGFCQISAGQEDAPKKKSLFDESVEGKLDKKKLDFKEVFSKYNNPEFARKLVNLERHEKYGEEYSKIIFELIRDLVTVNYARQREQIELKSELEMLKTNHQKEIDNLIDNFNRSKALAAIVIVAAALTGIFMYYLYQRGPSKNVKNLKTEEIGLRKNNEMVS